MEPQDELVAVIRRYVTTLVPPPLVEPVTQATCLAVARLMADPNFTNQLALVNDLRQENAWLRNNLMIAQEALRGMKRSSSTTRAKTTSPRPRKSPGRRTSPPKGAQTAFQQGVRDVRRGLG